MWTYAHPEHDSLVLLRGDSSSPDEAVVFQSGNRVCDIEALGHPDVIRNTEYHGEHVAMDDIFHSTQVRRGVALQAALRQKKLMNFCQLRAIGHDLGFVDGKGTFQPILDADATIPIVRETTWRLESGEGARLTPSCRTPDGRIHALAKSAAIPPLAKTSASDLRVVIDIDQNDCVELSLWDESSGHALCGYVIDPRSGTVPSPFLPAS